MKVLFYTGKGGVGKSTMAAETAWQLSEKYRVLIVSLDPAHNLGDLYGIELGRERFRFKENLYLQEIDVTERSRSHLQQEIKTLSQTYSYLQTLNLDAYFSILKYSPGLEEYTLISSIEETIASGSEFDYIVFDTPPTGLTLRFLALPQVTLAWLERLIEVRRQILKKRHTIRQIRGKPPESGGEGETVLDFDEGEDKVLKRLLALDEKYQALNRTLQGDLCTIALVFNADFLSFRESERLVKGLKELKLPLRLLIHNKFGQVGGKQDMNIDDSMRKLVNGLPLERVPFEDVLHHGANGRPGHIPQNIISNL